MQQDLPTVTVLAIFNDQVSAEIACALLSEASIHSDEPQATDDGSWLVSVRSVHPNFADRAEVILRSARARETTIARNGRQTAYVFSEPRPTIHVREQDNVLPAAVQEAFGHSIPASPTDVPELS
jgi:hypothetical protein